MPAEHPFSSAYSPRLVCVTEAWRDALARLDEGLGERERIVLVTGEAGTGKTALVLDAATRWGERARVVCVTNPALTRLELLEELARRLGAEPPAGASKPQLLGLLDTRLAGIASNAQAAVIVFEDAHQLTDEAFEELRLLVNSEAQAQRALALVFVGMPALEERMASPALTALGQRVTAHCRLEPLSNKATRRYLVHRIEATGGDAGTLLPRQAATEIHTRSHGVPRAINTIATEALRLAREAGLASVTPDHVRAASGRQPVGTAAKPAATIDKDDARVAKATAKPDAEPRRVGAPAADPGAEPPAPRVTAPTPDASGSAANDARVSDWVSRFVGSQGPPRIGSALSMGDADTFSFDSEPVSSSRPSYEPHEPEFETRSHETDVMPGDSERASGVTSPAPAKKPLRLIVLDDLPEDLPAARAARAPLPPVRHRSQASVTGPVIAGGVFVAAALVTVMVLSRGRNLLPQRSGVAATTVSKLPAAPAPLAAQSRAPIVEPVRAEQARATPDAIPATVTDAAISQGAQLPGIANASTTAPPADSVIARPVKQRLALDVGSYIDPERARLECDHLIAQTGLQVWVVETTENGGASYRVVIGVFSSEERADTSANSLLERGLISEARVVPLPSRRSRR